MTRIFRLLCAALFLLAALPSNTHAQSFPKLTGRVVDDANIIDPTAEAALTAKLEALEKQSGRQLVVATVPTLQDYDISDYAYRLGRAWGVGQKDTNNGTVFLVAPNERKVFIATGYGVEGIITDAVASQIIRNAVTPRFKAGDYPGGITAGVDELGRLLTLPPDEARQYAQQAEQNQRSGNDGGGSIVMVIFWVVVILFFIVPMAMGGRRGRRYRGGAGPVILWGPGLGGDDSGGSGWGGGGWGGGSGGGGGFSGGGGSFGGGGAGGSW